MPIVNEARAMVNPVCKPVNNVESLNGLVISKRPLGNEVISGLSTGKILNR